MRRLLFVITLTALSAKPVTAETADEVVARYLRAVGGAERIRAVQTLRLTGRSVRGGGVEVAVVEEHRRPNLVREETTRGGMTGAVAYDGSAGWKVEPWRGRKDPQPLSEDELKAILDDADFDGPLVDYAKKGVRLELLGKDEFEGTDVVKLRATTPQGSVLTYYLDSESYVPIKIETKRMVRGVERVSETLLGDYKPIAGWMLPFSYEVGVKGSEQRRQIDYDTIEANVSIGDDRFRKPAVPGAAAEPKPRAR